MTFLRNLASDLVEKRLWPIAVGLLVAIVAIPLVLGGGGAPTPSSHAPAPLPTPAAGPTAQVRLDTSAPARTRSRASHSRNPFTSRSMPKAAAPASATVTTVAVPASTGSPAVNAPSGTASKPAKSVSMPAQKPAVKQRSKKTKAVTHKKAAARAVKYRVAWRFGAEGAQRGKHDAARLTALPSVDDPAVLFLGLLKRKYGTAAVFLVKPGTQVHGDGRCNPDPANCQTLEMRAGHTEFIELGSGTPGIAPYRLDVVHIERKMVAARTARRLRMRSSQAGRKVLRAAIAAHVPGVSDFVFDHGKGLLAPYVRSAKR